MSSVQARTPARKSAAAPPVNLAGRLELLEYYLEHYEDVSQCAQASLEWLARHAGIRQSLCLAVDADSSLLIALAASGITSEDVEMFSWPLTDVADPLVAALSAGAPVFFKAQRHNGHVSH